MTELKKEWFVLHVLSGQEHKARENLEKRIQREEMQEYIGEILLPEERVTEVKSGKKKTIVRKLYPGYIFLEAVIYDEERRLLEKTWAFFKSTPGIIGFIGGDRPVPVPLSEVESIQNQMEEKRDRVKPRVSFDPGENVKITDGPFVGLLGIVEEVDPDKGKLKVSVTIFGRTTPVELEYWQVERSE